MEDKRKHVARIGALIMILCGLFPPIGQFVRTIPTSVIGGVLLMVLGQILVSGFQMISEAGFTPRNKLIVSLSLAIGMVLPPQRKPVSGKNSRWLCSPFLRKMSYP